MKDPMGLDRSQLERIMDAVGFRISAIGEYLDAPSLIYNCLIFKHLQRWGEHSGPSVVSVMRMLYPRAETFLDVGCGSGAIAAACQAAGLDVTAVEHSKHGQRLACRQGIDCRKFDLLKTPVSNIRGVFDVVYCFEVAEHISADLSHRLVDFIACHAVNIVFTAAQPGQRGFGHINCQPKGHWIRKFQEAGFEFRSDETEFAIQKLRELNAAYWFINNLMLFHKK